jgi:hypothetical protein
VRRFGFEELAAKNAKGARKEFTTKITKNTKVSDILIPNFVRFVSFVVEKEIGHNQLLLTM